jgi:hypothetical protein
MDFGGPVWHASASAINETTAWAMAERALLGVGDPLLGEWRERGQRGVMHVRRRLSDAEKNATAFARYCGTHRISGRCWAFDAA